MRSSEVSQGYPAVAENNPAVPMKTLELLVCITEVQGFLTKVCTR